MPDFFLAIYTFNSRRKLLSAGIAVLFLFVICLFAFKISFQENIDQLIPVGDHTAITTKVLNQISFADKITFIIHNEGETGTDELESCANDLTDSLQTSCNQWVGNIQGKVSDEGIKKTIDFVYAHLPLFLDSSDYAVLAQKMIPDGIAETVQEDYKSLLSPNGMITKDLILRDPLGISFIAVKKLQQLSAGNDFTLENGYVYAKNKKDLLLFLTPRLPANETEQNTLFVARLAAIQKALNTRYKGKLSVSYFGATPVAVSNASQVKSDIRNTSIFASVFLIIILVFFYRNLLIPVIIFIPSIIGGLLALTILYFTKGTISAISLGISSILLGETTDYSIYVLTHLRNNKDPRLLFKDITRPLILCGATTSITFLCLFFVKSEVLMDLGVFAALSVMASTIFSLVLIPQFYKIKKNGIETPKGFNLVDKLGGFDYHKNKVLIAISLAVLVLSCFTYKRAKFNIDLSSLNYMTPELRKADRDLEKLANDGVRSIYLVSYGNSYEAAAEINNHLFGVLSKEKNNGTITNISSIGGVVFSEKDQQKKLADWNNFWQSRKEMVQRELITSGGAFGFKADAFGEFYTMLNQTQETIKQDVYKNFLSLFLDDFFAQKNGLFTISSLVKVSVANRDRFVERVQHVPGVVVIDRKQMNESLLGKLKDNFVNLIDYSFIAIFLMLLYAFRRIELVFVTIIPIFISWVVTTGLMGILGLEFNILNIIVCTLIFGIGVDYSIFMSVALQKEYTFGQRQLPTYRTSIVLSVATTILGIGVLIFAKHPALKSISAIAIVGILSTVIITFVIQPLVFAFIANGRACRGQAPLQLRTFIHSLCSLAYYGLGGIIISLFSLTIMKLIPRKSERLMLAYRYVISKFMWSVLVSNPFFRKKIVNPHREKFKKPAIIIANHASFLDILTIGMLSHRIIYLVNDWVYNSPVFGEAVKMAGFYPVSKGLEGGVDYLKEKVDQGYSLVIFPEGTRSETNHVHRFHKGAFYLAEHFNIDIVPIIIHGNSEGLPKGDFIIYDGNLTIKILERITPQNTNFGNNYTERTKKINRWFRDEFNKARKQFEGTNYFRKTIINSFDYKEVDVIKVVKKDIRENLSKYFQMSGMIEDKTEILHIANDYGQLDCLLTLMEPQRRIISYISEKDKRSVARGNYIVKKRPINYIDKLPQHDKKFGVVLVSSLICEYNLEVLVEYADKIILSSAIFTNSVINNVGFELETEQNGLFVLNKKKG